MTSRRRGRISLISGALLLLALFSWLLGSPGGDGLAQHGHDGWQTLTNPEALWSFAGLQSLSLLAAAIIAGTPIAISAVNALRYRAFSIDLLVTVAVTGALIIGEFTEAGVVAFLFIFGSWLEARSLERTRASVGDLIDMAPTTADVKRAGGIVTVPVEEVEVGEIVVLRTGSQAPVDGEVTSGRGYIDEATITGEPVPAQKKAGEKVYSGTMVTDGFFEVEARTVGDQTTFAKIIEMVEDAQDSKGNAQRFLDRFSRIYTPAVLVASFAAFLITQNIHFALTFLVIACPGALVISTPVSMVAGIGNGARHGVLLKGGDAVERLAGADTLVVDKTGTLTFGQPEVTEVISHSPISEEDLLLRAASVETASEHPLGRAVVDAAKERRLELGDPADVEVLAGVGISGAIGGERIAVGSRRLLIDQKITLSAEQQEQAETLEDQGATVFFVTSATSGLLGTIAVADKIRPDAVALNNLRRYGIQNIVMLTGDNRRTAAAVAATVGIDEVHAELLPHEKVDVVKKLTDSGRKVAMIGDGINDAPAIAMAHVGVAMGSGTDVSIEAADVVLAGGRLDQLVHARQLAKATTRNVLQNTAVALVTVAGLLAGVIAGVVFMGLGMLIHEASVLLVILNALRLVRYQPRSHRRTRRQDDAASRERELQPA